MRWQLKPMVQFSLAANHAYFVVKHFPTFRAVGFTMLVEPFAWLSYQSLRTAALLITFPFRLAGTLTGLARGLLNAILQKHDSQGRE